MTFRYATRVIISSSLSLTSLDRVFGHLPTVLLVRICFFVPGFFEKLSSEPPWRNKVLAGISEGTDNSGDMAITRCNQQLLETKFDATAITTKPFQNSNLDEELMIEEIPKKTPTNLESQLYRTLMLTLHSKLAMVSNSTTTMGSPKSQPIINESISFNAPLISVVEVKTDIVA